MEVCPARAQALIMLTKVASSGERPEDLNDFENKLGYAPYFMKFSQCLAEAAGFAEVGDGVIDFFKLTFLCHLRDLISQRRSTPLHDKKNAFS